MSTSFHCTFYIYSTLYFLILFSYVFHHRRSSTRTCMYILLVYIHNSVLSTAKSCRGGFKILIINITPYRPLRLLVQVVQCTLYVHCTK